MDNSSEYPDHPYCIILESRKGIYSKVIKYIGHLLAEKDEKKLSIQAYNSKKRKLNYSPVREEFYLEKYDFYVKNIGSGEEHHGNGFEEGDTDDIIMSNKWLEFYSKKQDITNFFIDVEEYDTDPEPSNIILYEWANHWYQLMKLKKRPIDTIYLDLKTMDRLISEVTDFLDTEEDYLEHGLPYKKCFLFSGPPGTGKSSLIASIASRFDYNLACVSFTRELDDKAIRLCISALPKKTFLVFEDIDALFDGRESIKQVSFSGFLNIIDGLCRINQLVIFMTTNHPEQLDPALLRPGRVDTHYKFTYASKEQIFQAFLRYRPTETKEDFDNFYSKVSKNHSTMCVFQKFFFKFRKSPGKLVDHVEDLNEYINEYYEQESKTRAPNGIFS